MVEPIVDHYKAAKLKIRIGIYAQSSTLWDMKKDFDQTLELLVLSKNGNLEFDIVHEEGVLAKYTIYDLEKSNLLIDQTKAYQVSLFNKDKAVGAIKYQIDWLHWMIEYSVNLFETKTSQNLTKNLLSSEKNKDFLTSQNGFTN